MPLSPLDVLPEALAVSIAGQRCWFVIGGQAVRCYMPYRPSRDADFGVFRPRDLKQMVRALKACGQVELIETGEGTVHLTFEGIDVSLFVLPQLEPHVAGHALTVTGVLATKTHAILDRGTRRDFFDLYVMLQSHGLGILECLNALQSVYTVDVNQGLVLRALTYFDDANAETRLPGEGTEDWERVRDYFTKAVAALIVPPTQELRIQSRVVDVRSPKPEQRAPRSRSRARPKAKSR